jgi:hypothetical protein
MTSTVPQLESTSRVAAQARQGSPSAEPTQAPVPATLASSTTNAAGWIASAAPVPPQPELLGLHSKSPLVRELKELLATLGFYDGVLNDQMGTMGLASLKAAKKAYQIGGPEDVAGPTTMAILRQEVEKKKAAKRATPMIDQHSMNSVYSYGYCGVASTLMTIARARGGIIPIAIGNNEQLEDYADQMYILGVGSDAGLMAAAMRRAGVPAEEVAGASVADIVQTLQAGQSVPLGVDRLKGTITKDVYSTRYKQLKADKFHIGTYPDSGHWVVVTGFEGPPNNPTFFTVNDPDSGAVLRLSRDELDYSADFGNMLLIRRPK